MVFSARAEEAFEISAAAKVDLLNYQTGQLEDNSAVAHLELGAGFDLDALFQLSGIEMYAELLLDWGGRPNETQLDTLFGVSNLEVAEPAARASQLWLQYTTGNHQVLAGLYGLDSEFMALESAGMFSNPAYGPTGDLSLTDTPSVFPTSAFGVRWRYENPQSHAYFAAAVLDGVAGDPDDPTATSVDFESQDGAFTIVEAGIGALEQDHWFKVAGGFWWYSEPRARLDDDQILADRFGLYGQVEGELWHTEDNLQSIDSFFRVSVNDGRSIAFDQVYSAGLVWHGTLQRLPDSALGLSYSRGMSSDAWRQFGTISGDYVDSNEAVLEVAFKRGTGSHVTIQPFYQHVTHPGTLSDAPSIDLFGIHLEWST